MACFLLLYLLLPALALCCLGFAYFRYSRRRLYELAAKIPGPEGHPLLGSCLVLTGTHEDFFERLYTQPPGQPNKTGPVKMWLGPQLFVGLQDPRDMEAILGSSDHLDRAPEYRFLQHWTGDGLLISSPARWAAHRRLLTPAFHLGVLKSFVGLFNSNSRAAVDRLRAEVGREFDAHEHMGVAAVEMLLETALGVRKPPRQSVARYVESVMGMWDMWLLRTTGPWLRVDLFFRLSKYFRQERRLMDVIEGLEAQAIRDKRAALQRGVRGPLARCPDADHSGDEAAKKHPAFLELLIDAAHSGLLTEQDVVDEVKTLMFAGLDTTATTSSFFLSVLGLHRDVQERVFHELEDIFGDSDRPATYEDTLEMKYLERCLLETLRLYPSVPFMARQLRREVEAPSTGVVLPAGCTVFLSLARLHRNADAFADPHAFDPDNFLAERCAPRHRYAYVPFSAGPRGCVGQKYAMLELKILLSTVLRHFRVRAAVQETDFQLKTALMLRREGGYPITLEPRGALFRK